MKTTSAQMRATSVYTRATSAQMSEHNDTTNTQREDGT